MFVAALLVAVVGLTTFVQIKEYKKFLAFINEYQAGSKKKLSVSPIAKSNYFMAYGLGGLALALCVAVLLFPSISPEGQQLYYAFYALCLAFLFVSSLYLSKQKVSLYYDEEGFIGDNKYIKYSSVKSVTRKVTKYNMYEVNLYSGDKVEIASTLADFLKNEVENYKENKKKKKK